MTSSEALHGTVTLRAQLVGHITALVLFPLPLCRGLENSPNSGLPQDVSVALPALSGRALLPKCPMNDSCCAYGGALVCHLCRAICRKLRGSCLPCPASATLYLEQSVVGQGPRCTLDGVGPVCLRSTLWGCMLLGPTPRLTLRRLRAPTTCPASLCSDIGRRRLDIGHRCMPRCSRRNDVLCIAQCPVVERPSVIGILLCTMSPGCNTVQYALCYALFVEQLCPSGEIYIFCSRVGVDVLQLHIGVLRGPCLRLRNMIL
jgi:hypothetical protein